jgi:hypothetical protein
MMRSRSDELNLILLAAGTASRRERMRGEAERMGQRADWDLIAQMLRARRLLPTLGPRLIEMAGPGRTEHFAAAVGESVTGVSRQGALMELVGSRAIGALAAAGIRCSPLKGPWLSERLYGDCGRRVSTDIDLLVAEDELLEAVRVVGGLGYLAPSDRVDADGLPLLHFVLLDGREAVPPIELHWRIHWYERRFAAERLLAPRLDSGDDWCPAPIDEFAALLLFYARDGFIDLRLASDIGACWDAYGDSFQEGALDDTIDAYPALERVLLASLDVASRTVGLPAAGLVRRYRRLPRRSVLAGRLANPHPHSSVPQLYADIGLIDGLLAPPGGFSAFFRRQVAPRRESPETASPEPGEAEMDVGIGRSIRMLARYALVAPRLLRSSLRPMVEADGKGAF